jgi:hypothetical protein
VRDGRMRQREFQQFPITKCVSQFKFLVWRHEKSANLP